MLFSEKGGNGAHVAEMWRKRGSRGYGALPLAYSRLAPQTYVKPLLSRFTIVGIASHSFAELVGGVPQVAGLWFRA